MIIVFLASYIRERTLGIKETLSIIRFYLTLSSPPFFFFWGGFANEMIANILQRLTVCKFECD